MVAGRSGTVVAGGVEFVRVEDCVHSDIKRIQDSGGLLLTLRS